MRSLFSLLFLITLFCNKSEALYFNSKRDTIVIEFDQNNRLLIPKMYTYEPGLESLLFVSYPELQRNDSLEFELSFWGIDGDIMGNELIFEVKENFVIDSIAYKFSRALYFSEDGSGGTWGASDDYFTDMRSLYLYEPNLFRIPDYKDSKPFPIIPEEAIIYAESELKKNPMLDYSEYTGSFLIRIDYRINNEKNFKVISFNYLHGD